MKKLINDPAQEGMAGVCPHLRLVPQHKILVHHDIDAIKQRQVTLLSGGGSGHEPAHAGYIGNGALTGVICGEVFSSPSQAAILAAIRLAAGPHGVLLIVKNYTGDKINFRLAAELARTSYNIRTEIVIIADDVALLDSSNSSPVGARGLAGVVLLHKLLGEKAKRGESLENLAAYGREIAKQIKTMGVALTSATLPAVGHPNFHINPKDMEVGLGIHGEAGVRKAPLASADEVADLLLTQILKYSPKISSATPQKEIILLINNLGSLTAMELAIIARRALKTSQDKALVVERIYVGAYLTALDMSGVSISVLPADPTVLDLLDSRTDALSWIHSATKPHTALQTLAAPSTTPPTLHGLHKPSPELASTIHKCLEAVCHKIYENADHLSALDAAVGDGDLGGNLRTVALGILAQRATLNFKDTTASFHRLAILLEEKAGGTSGPLLAVFFLRLATALEKTDPALRTSWIAAFEDGIRGIEYLGESTAGDRTLLDALWPALNRLKELEASKTAKEAVGAMATAAQEGVEKTKTMHARRGRATYLQDKVLGHVDPGAKAVQLMLQATHEAL